MNGNRPSTLRFRFERRTPSAGHTILLAAMVAALLAGGGAFAQHWVHERASQAQAVHVELLVLASLTSRTDVIESAIVGDPADLLDIFANSHALPIFLSIDRLSALSTDADASAVVASFQSYRAGIEQARTLAMAGQQGEAEALIAEQVHPNGIAFNQLVDATLPVVAKRAENARRLESAFALVSIAAGSALLGFLVLRLGQNRRRTRVAQQETREIEAEQTALWKIGELSVSDMDMSSLLPQISSMTLGIAGIECCSIEMWYPDQDRTRLVAEATIPEWPGTAEVPIWLDLNNYPHSRQVLEQRRPLRIAATDDDLAEFERDQFVEAGTGSMLLMPLLIDRRCLGILTLHSRKTDAFDERSIAMAGELAAVIALAIENARFRDEIRGHVAEQARLLDASRDAEERYRTLVEQLPAITYVESLQSGDDLAGYDYVSPQVESMLGYPAELWRSDGGLWRRIVHPEDRDRILARNAERLASGQPFREEYRVVATDGRVVWLYDEATLVRDENGAPRYWHGIQLNTTPIKEAEQKQREAEAEFRLLFSRNPHPTMVCDRDTLAIMEVNEIAVTHYGYARDTFLQMRYTELLAEVPAGAILSPDGKRSHTGRAQHRTSTGSAIDVEITAHALEFRGRPALLIIAQDMTVRLSLEARLAHQAYHDMLTSLPNRARFAERLARALNGRDPVTVLFIDLDNFKVTNDTLGHNAGDQLLIAVGERLAHVLPPGDTLARLGGDEFTVLIERGGELGAGKTAERIHRTLQEPFMIAGHEIIVTASIGIAIGMPGEDSADEVLRRADIAMYEAKQRGRAQFVTFHQEMGEGAWRRLSMDSELRHALKEDQFRLHFQPIIDLRSGEMTEVEALVRWDHPVRGLIGPAEFIPLAEETGTIVPIGLWVLREACAQGAIWLRDYAHRSLTVGVNLSARQFLQPALVAEIEQVLAETGLPARCLKVEITETVALNDIETSAATLRALKAIGVQLAMDDFGTGYSSLSNLRLCPIDTLKIDRSYIAALGHHAADTALVRAVLAFARSLDLSVTAEGVETAEQVAELRALGCDRAQGFYFARPMDAADLSRLLTNTPALASAAAD